MSLSAHKGKQIVILDFWATWCGPCVKGMPITQKVAKQYASKGVVLYAVNLKEDAKKIRTFLTKQKLKINVLLDSKGTIAKNYGVNSIPMLVLIDKDGTVQKVHIGLSNSLENSLKRDLDALVAGKKIAKPAASRGQNQRGGFPGQGGAAGGAGGFPGQGGVPGGAGGFPGQGGAAGGAGGFPGQGGVPGGAGGFPGQGGAAGGAGGFPGQGGAPGGAGGFPGQGGAPGGAGGFPGQGGAGGGFPGQGGVGQKKPQPKPGTPEYAADDFVAKMIAGNSKAAAAMVASSARTPALKELLKGNSAKSAGQWKQVLQGAQRNGVARAVGANRVVTLTNSKRQTVRITLQRKGSDYKIYSIAVGSSSTKKRRRR